MNRAEMRRKAREQEKCRLPLNFKMQLGQVAGLTGQQSMILQNYLKAREDEITPASVKPRRNWNGQKTI